MAIAEMSRIRIYGLESERERLLETLMWSGAIQLEDATAEAGGAQPDAAASGDSVAPGLSLRRIDDAGAVHDADALVGESAAALAVLDRHAPVKRGMFSVRRSVDVSGQNDCLARREPILEAVRAIRRTEEGLTGLKAEEVRIQGRLAFLRPWLGIGVDLSRESTRSTVIQAGTLPAKQDAGALEAGMQAVAPASLLVAHATEGDVQYCVAVWHAAESAEAQRVLKEAGWNRVAWPESGTPDVVADELNRRLAEIETEKAERIAQITACAGSREEIEAFHDAMLMERDRLAARSRIAATGRAFLVTGWIPEDAVGRLTQRLDRDFTCHVETEAPDDEAEIPVLVRNNGITEAIRPVMDMYGAPSAREIDPNFLTLPFFAIFFGLIMGDAGYGLILTAGAAIVLRKFKLEAGTRQFAKLILFCGIATMFWGVLFGSFFGIEALSKYALWFSPGEAGGTERLMSWCLLFGIIHLFTGLGMKAANLIRKRHFLDALCDVGFPYVMFTGFAMTVLPYVPGLDPAMTAPISATGLYVFIVGTSLVVLTAGRKSKSLFGKIFGGLPRLYDIVGFLGDTLSYMRLLALCLAGGILGGLINGMASDLGNIVARILGGTVLLLFGHSINFAMSVLGAFVHSCRLQYLEFFSKFLEGGGKPFRPFGPRTQYTVMKQED